MNHAPSYNLQYQIPSISLIEVPNAKLIFIQYASQIRILIDLPRGLVYSFCTHVLRTRYQCDCHDTAPSSWTTAHSARLYVYSSSMFCATQRTAELHSVSTSTPDVCCRPTHLSMTSPFATTFPTPIQIVGQTYSATMYFSTKTTTLPASPPASSANPKNSTSLAFQATPFPEYEKESADRRDLSIELMTSIPRAEQIPGIQSTKVTCTGGSEGFMADLDQDATSISMKKPSENYTNELSAIPSCESSPYCVPELQLRRRPRSWCSRCLTKPAWGSETSDVKTY